MKVAFVVGFFDPIESTLRAEFSSELEDGALIWIRGRGVRRPLNLESFKGPFCQVLADGTDDPILLLYARLRGFDYVEYSLKAIIDSNSAGRQVDFLGIEDLQDSERLIRELTQFGLSVRTEIVTETMLCKLLGGSKVLCVRAERQANFKKTLVPFTGGATGPVCIWSSSAPSPPRKLWQTGSKLWVSQGLIFTRSRP